MSYNIDSHNMIEIRNKADTPQRHSTSLQQEAIFASLMEYNDTHIESLSNKYPFCNVDFRLITITLTLN